jgi:hypothetical protein
MMSRAEAMRFIQAQLPSARITCIDLTGQREWARMRAATANRRWASTLACLVSTAVLVPMIAATAAAAPSHTGFEKCGDIATLTSWDIRAKRVGCHKAKQVVRAYSSAIAEGGDSTQEVLGFLCKTAGNYGDGANYRCTAKGHRVVQFSRGG